MVRGSEPSRSSFSSAIILVLWFYVLLTLQNVAQAQDLSCGTGDIEIPYDFSPTEAGANEFPWLVRLSVRCTAAILGRQWAITAAHCIYGGDGFSVISPNDLLIYVNDFSLTSRDRNERVIYTEKVIPHPLYNPDSYDHDFALIRLAEPLNWSENLRPICLLQNCEAELQPGPNVTCLLAGWGSDRISYGYSTELDSRLRKQLINPIDRTTCQDSISRQSFLGGFQLTPQMTCAGYMRGGIDECQSDSGGPLICRSNSKPSFYLHGISSFGFGCGLPRGFFRLYSRPCAITSWILASTRPRAP